MVFVICNGYIDIELVRYLIKTVEKTVSFLCGKLFDTFLQMVLLHRPSYVKHVFRLYNVFYKSIEIVMTPYKSIKIGQQLFKGEFLPSCKTLNSLR